MCSVAPDEIIPQMHRTYQANNYNQVTDYNPPATWERCKGLNEIKL